MFRFLARLAVRRPVLTTMIVGTFVILGVFSYFTLAVDLMPGMDFPYVTVTTVYPGAGPEDVETEVTEKVEDAVSTIANVRSLTSFSQENVSFVIAEFDYSVDPDLAAIDVKDKVDAIRADLPTDAQPPTILKLDINAMPIMDVTLSGPQSLEALTDFAHDVMRERLSRVNGVASVTLIGGRTSEIEVLVHPDRLRAYGLAITDIAAIVGTENLSVPVGRITRERSEVSIRVVGEYGSVREIQELPVFLPSGGRIRLAEIAAVREGVPEVREIARFNGQPAVSLSIQKQSGANTVSAAAGVYQALDELRPQLPPGALIETAHDSSTFIRDAIRDILTNILIGIALTTGVLFVFLHSWRGTVIAAVAMPATIVSTFLALDQAGFSINVMTLMGLGITVGILVTNTVIVLENIYRYLDLGATPHEAAEKGSAEVAVAVTASTLTNVVVFTPIAFMGGLIGQFFTAFGLTVVFATFFSILISFTITPMLAARLLRMHETELDESEGRLSGAWKSMDKGYRGFEGDYRRGLAWVLTKPSRGWALIGGTFALLVLAMVIQVAFVGGELLPVQDEGLAQVTLELPPGTPPERTAAVAARAESLLVQVPEVGSTLIQIGGAGRGFAVGQGTANVAQIQVTIDSDEPTAAILPRLRELMAAIPDADVTVVVAETMGGGNEAPLQILIKGPDQDRIQELAQQATPLVAALPGLTNVSNTIEDPRPEVVFLPRREVLSEYGLTVGAVGGMLRASIEGVTSGVYREAGDERDIRVRLAEDARADVQQLAALDVRTPRGLVPLAVLGTIENSSGETTIQRDEKQRTVRIDAYIGSGNLAAQAQAVQLALDEMAFPPGYGYEITGQFEMYQESLTEMLKSLVMAVILTYVVLAMILESFVHPVTIMLTLPLGAVGAIFGLFLTGVSLNIFSMMALIMLVGIVVNNAILILDYVQILRREGKGIVEALLEAAPARLRPIVMTNIAIAIALIPQAVGSGAGSFYRVPMAVVTIGGVLVAAVFTLFLIPVIYVKLDRFAFAAHVHEREERERSSGAHPRAG